MHSRRIVDAEGDPAGEGDGLISRDPGRMVAVRTADCLPVLIADERTRTVAALHAGWRGVLLGIGAAAVERLGASGLWVALGPGIGACCFAVGGEVAARFRDLFPERADLDGPARIDLAEALKRQLIGARVPGDRISVAGLCTRCRGGEFHSWRRDRERSGRMHSWIAVRP